MRPEIRPLSSARHAIIETLPEETSLFGRSLDVRFTYIPASHAKALYPDTQLVVGMRGAGKSFWWAALQSERHRELVARFEPRAGLAKDTQIAVGFGEIPDPDRYPGRDQLARLVAQGYDPRMIWLTVILRALAGSQSVPGSNWSERVGYLSHHPDVIEEALYQRDVELDSKASSWVILFDALDRSAADWATMFKLIRGLLQALLDLRPYRRLRAKCFLRTDQVDEREVATFPDASKVLAAKVELSWPPRELYGLFFQYLGNSPSGAFREEVASLTRQRWEELAADGLVAWRPPDDLRRDEDAQRGILHAITGPWMGRDKRRGFPYTWIATHLADAEGRTSPRSLLAALRKAAEDTRDRYPNHEWPLHYESIKRGVQEASTIRKREIQEDYPWVDALMGPLHGQVVPCPFAEISEAWRNARAIEGLQGRVAQAQEKLSPAHLEAGPDGLRADLEDLGIFLSLSDGRINIPDVFRIGYGLGRRGGVRPFRSVDER